eukprot:7626085-Pyramimonas_sp.AAC.1
MSLFEKAASDRAPPQTAEILCGKSLQPIRQVTQFLTGPPIGGGATMPAAGRGARGETGDRDEGSTEEDEESDVAMMEGAT